jgi:hypothetical protein
MSGAVLQVLEQSKQVQATTLNELDTQNKQLDGMNRKLNQVSETVDISKESTVHVRSGHNNSNSQPHSKEPGSAGGGTRLNQWRPTSTLAQQGDEVQQRCSSGDAILQGVVACRYLSLTVSVCLLVPESYMAAQLTTATPKAAVGNDALLSNT